MECPERKQRYKSLKTETPGFVFAQNSPGPELESGAALRAELYRGNGKRLGLAVLVGVGRCHRVHLYDRQILKFAHGEQAKSIAHAGALRVDPQVDGSDEMFGRQGPGVLGVLL